MEKITHQMRLQQWSKIISECLASGLNKTAWCRQNGISDKQFFYWQKILRREAYALAETSHDGASIPATAQTPSIPFVELKMDQSASVMSAYTEFKPEAVIQINGMIIGFTNTASSELIRSVGGMINAK